MNIGIMGGTFNPIHNGHLALAKAAMEQFPLDTVWFMPSGLPAHKSNDELADGSHRLNMTKLALIGQKGFEASDFELKQEGYTYTANTLSALSKLYPSDTFHFIIGGDSLMKFLCWRNPEVILQKAILLAAGRDGFTKEELAEQAELLRRTYHARIHFVEMEEITVSSHEIRAYCKNGQYKKVSKYLPEAVLDYIKEKNLFEKTAESEAVYG